MAAIFPFFFGKELKDKQQNEYIVINTKFHTDVPTQTIIFLLLSFIKVNVTTCENTETNPKINKITFNHVYVF